LGINVQRKLFKSIRPNRLNRLFLEVHFANTARAEQLLPEHDKDSKALRTE